MGSSSSWSEWVRLSLCFSLKDIKIHTQYRSGWERKGIKTRGRRWLFTQDKHTNFYFSLLVDSTPSPCTFTLSGWCDMKILRFWICIGEAGRVEMLKRTDNFPVMTLIDFKLQIQLGRGFGIGWISSLLSCARVVWGGWNEFAKGADMWYDDENISIIQFKQTDDETNIIFEIFICKPINDEKNVEPLMWFFEISQIHHLNSVVSVEKSKQIIRRRLINDKLTFPALYDIQTLQVDHKQKSDSLPSRFFIA